MTIGRTAYVVGGYSGRGMDREVVATADGRRFHPVTALPVPVRYPAVAALGSSIYVFGGLGANGRPVDTVQRIDTGTSGATVVGHLPRPVSAAAAGTIDGTIYVAGGRTLRGPTSAVYAFKPHGASLLRAGSLRVPVANAGTAVTGGRLWIVGGETRGGKTGDVRGRHPEPGFGTAGAAGAGSPFSGGKLLIADRGNDRLLVVNARSECSGASPPRPTRRRPAASTSPTTPSSPTAARDHLQRGAERADRPARLPVGQAALVLRAPGRRRLRTRLPARARRRLPPAATGRSPSPTRRTAACCSSPARRRSCREIGSPAACSHEPPDPSARPTATRRSPNGNILVSEVNGSYIDEITPGKLVWSVQLPIDYPSDPQQLGPNRYLVADYTHARRDLRVQPRAARSLVLPAPSGNRMLNHPSLAERLPNGR